MATPVRGAGGRRRRGRRAEPGRASWSRTARTASSSPARRASRRPSTTTSTSALLRAIVDEVGDEATIALRHRHQRHQPLDRADQGRRRCRRRSGPGRHALLQQAQPGRDPRPLRSDRGRRPRPAADRLQHPLAGDRQRLAGRTRRAGRDRQRGRRSSRRTTTSSARSTGMAVLAGNDDIFLRTPRNRRSPAASWSPRTWSARRCARSGTRPRPATSSGRARSTQTLRPLYEALGVTTNPIPVKAAHGDARPDPVRHACGCRWSGSTKPSASVVRAALESVGLTVTAG